MKSLSIFFLVFAIVKMFLCERLGKADLVRYGNASERNLNRKIKFRKSNRIYYPPEIPIYIHNQPINEGLFQNEAYFLKSLKQLLSHTRRRLDTKENWSRLDENDYESSDRITDRKKNENNFLNLNSKKKKKDKKKCKCECEKDLIITVPKYKYRDIPLGNSS